MLSSEELIAAYKRSERSLGEERYSPFNLFCEGYYLGVRIGKADMREMSLDWLERHLPDTPENRKEIGVVLRAFRKKTEE